MYEYKATITKIVDGDSVHADVDLGCDIHVNMTIRLAGINAPEKRTDAGKTAENALMFLLMDASAENGGDRNGPFLPIVIRTTKQKKEKFGRYLGTLILPDGTNVNQAMIDSGHAVAYDGGKR